MCCLFTPCVPPAALSIALALVPKSGGPVTCAHGAKLELSLSRTTSTANLPRPFIAHTPQFAAVALSLFVSAAGFDVMLSENFGVCQIQGLLLETERKKN